MKNGLLNIVINVFPCRPGVCSRNVHLSPHVPPSWSTLLQIHISVLVVLLYGISQHVKKVTKETNSKHSKLRGKQRMKGEGEKKQTAIHTQTYILIHSHLYKAPREALLFLLSLVFPQMRFTCFSEQMDESSCKPFKGSYRRGGLERAPVTSPAVPEAVYTPTMLRTAAIQQNSQDWVYNPVMEWI